MYEEPTKLSALIGRILKDEGIDSEVLEEKYDGMANGLMGGYDGVYEPDTNAEAVVISTLDNIMHGYLCHHFMYPMVEHLSFDDDELATRVCDELFEMTEDKFQPFWNDVFPDKPLDIVVKDIINMIVREDDFSPDDEVDFDTIE